MTYTALAILLSIFSLTRKLITKEETSIVLAGVVISVTRTAKQNIEDVLAYFDEDESGVEIDEELEFEEYDSDIRPMKSNLQ
jgi:hypothetical protein